MADLDYTTVQRVKDEMGSETTSTPTILAALIGAASRVIDRKCTGVSDNSAINYFRLETVTDEMLLAQIDAHGVIVTAPRKPSITAVTALSFRANPQVGWQSVDPTLIWADGGQLVRAYASSRTLSQLPVGRAQIKITYTGGLSADTAGLPDDLQEVATILAISAGRSLPSSRGGDQITRFSRHARVTAGPPPSPPEAASFQSAVSSRSIAATSTRSGAPEVNASTGVTAASRRARRRR